MGTHGKFWPQLLLSTLSTPVPIALTLVVFVFIALGMGGEVVSKGNFFIRRIGGGRQPEMGKHGEFRPQLLFLTSPTPVPSLSLLLSLFLLP